ncbi:heavy metal-binding protein HIP-like [Mya arenaria]|uniref:heavy metal-binding protein HIP-like n=1 Tax=Mya arenaria TaxID=6604 RepID=UPI0022E2124A|nr:heavy metal-binding protein HIP-like [Mya arenaria]
MATILDILVVFINVFVYVNQVDATKELLSRIDSPEIREILVGILDRLDEKDREQAEQLQEVAEQRRVNDLQIHELAEQRRINDFQIHELAEQRRLNELQQLQIQELENQLKHINNNCHLQPAIKHPVKQFKRRDGSYKGVQRTSRQVELEHPVAFFATLTNHTFHIGAGQSIKFDNVVTNVGQAYNHVLGAFLAPVSGIYVFSVTLFAYPGHTTEHDIMKNNVFISRLYMQAPSGYETASQTFILQLDKGDDVNVLNMLSDKAIHGGHYSTFAGFLLQQTYPAAVIG